MGRRRQGSATSVACIIPARGKGGAPGGGRVAPLGRAQGARELAPLGRALEGACHPRTRRRALGGSFGEGGGRSGSLGRAEGARGGYATRDTPISSFAAAS